MVEAPKTASKTRTIDIRDFFDGGIIREKSFREKIEATDWEDFRDHFHDVAEMLHIRRGAEVF